MSAWPRIPLGELCEVTAGGTPSRTITSNFGGDVPWVKIGDMLQGRVVTTEECLSRSGLENSAAKVLPAGTVVISIFATIGRTAVLGVDAATNQAIVGITPRDINVLLPEYLRRFLDSEAPSLERRARGVAQANINSSLLKAVPVPLPPLSEQRRIADILDKADALRAKRGAALAQLGTLSQSIFLDMFGDPIANTRRFPVKRLVELADPTRPITYGILKPGPNQEDGVKYVRVVDMKDGGIELSGIRKTTEAISNAYRRSLLKEGDLLLSIRGHVGRLAIVPAELSGANITQDTARLALKGIDALFVRECLRTPAFQQWMSRHTKGVAVRGINLGDVKLMPLLQPPAEQQNTFRRLVERVETARLAQSSSAAACGSLFRSLQSRIFSGQLL